MKFFAAATLASMAGLAIAAPPASLHQLQARELQKRQSSNEFKMGSCKSAIFFFSRGTFESGNIGFIIGPSLISAIKRAYPDIAIQGVDYPAAVTGNFNPGGADLGGIKTAQDLMTQATTKCPKAMLTAGGYSQGAALMHRAIEALPKRVQDRIVGVVLFGDTKNKQDGGRIKNFPPDKVKIYCNKDDGVCGGFLNVNTGHLAYSSSFTPAGVWLGQKLNAAKGSFGKGGGSGSDSAPAPKGGKGKGKDKDKESDAEESA